MIPKFTRLEIAFIIAIVIFIASCSPGKWVAGNTATKHYFSKQQVALRAYNESLKTVNP